MRWKLHEAKQKLGELLRLCSKNGPQVVTRHEKEITVVLSIDEYRRLAGVSRGFKEFFLSAPDLETLEIQRPRQGTGPVHLE